MSEIIPEDLWTLNASPCHWLTLWNICRYIRQMAITSIGSDLLARVRPWTRRKLCH